MLKLIGWRLVQLPFILLAVYSITFALAWVIPGNPLEKDGRRPSPEVMEAMSESYNLNDPVGFYTGYLWKASGGAWLAGDRDGPVFNFGPSLRHENWTVNEIIASQEDYVTFIYLIDDIYKLSIDLEMSKKYKKDKDSRLSMEN